MLNIGALYNYQSSNGDLSGNIEVEEGFASELDKARDFIQEKVGYDVLESFLRLLSEENSAYQKRAYEQGFKDAMSIINDSKK